MICEYLFRQHVKKQIVQGIDHGERIERLYKIIYEET